MDSDDDESTEDMQSDDDHIAEEEASDYEDGKNSKKKDYEKKEGWWQDTPLPKNWRTGTRRTSRRRRRDGRWT